MKKLLFLAEAVSLAHVGRPLTLAHWAKENGYEVHFACSVAGLSKTGSETFPFLTHPLSTISSSLFYNRVNKGSFFYTQDELKSYVEEEKKLIKKINPDLIITDFRLSAPISASLCNKPLLNLSNSHWSPNAECPFPAPQNGIFKWLPSKISKAVFSLIRPLAFKLFAENLNKVRKHYGLDEKKDFRELYTDGTHNAYLDMPEFSKLSSLPKCHFFLGPVIWNATTKNQNIFFQNKENVYISMGSTGNNELIDPIIKAVLKTKAFIILSGVSSEEEIVLLKKHEELKNRSLIKRLLNPEDILPYCKLTICHGGSGTVYQSLSFGTPVLCFPSNPDQCLVSYAVKKLQLGSFIEIANPTEMSIYKAIQNCLSNNEIINNAKNYSKKIAEHNTCNRWLQFLDNLLPKKTTAKEIFMKPSKRPSGVSLAFNQSMVSLKQTEPIKKITPSGYTIKIANTLAERESAYRLAYNVYLEKGYVKENPYKWLVKNQDASNDTITLIVLDKSKKTVGSVTMIFDGQDTIPAKTIYPIEINNLKKQNKKLVEISRLVIDPNYRNGKEILTILFNYLYIYANHVKKYTTLIVEVNPRHKEFYRMLLGFEVIGNIKPCPTVQDAPAVLMSCKLNIDENEIFKATHQNPEKKTHSLFPHFIKKNQEELVAAYLQKQHKPMTEEEKIYFGFTESTIGDILTV